MLELCAKNSGYAFCQLHLCRITKIVLLRLDGYVTPMLWLATSRVTPWSYVSKLEIVKIGKGWTGCNMLQSTRYSCLTYRTQASTRCLAPRSPFSSRRWPGASLAGCRSSLRTSPMRTPARSSCRSVENWNYGDWYRYYSRWGSSSRLGWQYFNDMHIWALPTQFWDKEKALISYRFVKCEMYI